VSEKLSVGWRDREPPLVPAAVAASGRAAVRLGSRLLARAGKEPGLSAVAGARLLVVLGPTSELPWSEGAQYLGRDAEAPHLLLPTALEPDVPVDVLEQALRARALAAIGPLAILPSAERTWVVPVGSARAVDPAALARWLVEQPQDLP